MKLISAVFLCWTLSAAYGSLCQDLTGTWRNQLNSNMTIQAITGNSFTGSYHTAVESTSGAARLTSKISGMIKSVENGKLIGFNVLWNRGASLTAWVGQCMVCDGQEKIYTTWVLRSYLPAKKRWMTTRINQDTFYRVENPSQEETESNLAIQSTLTENEPSNSDLRGMWVAHSTDSLEVNTIKEFGAFEGIHQSDGENGGLAVGRYDGNQTYTAVGFVASQSNKVRGYTGHIDNPTASGKVLETSWLEHTFHPDCRTPRKFVRFGLDHYAKVEV